MAGMKGFYVVLGGIAVAGTGAIWWATQNSAARVPMGPIASAAVDAARDFPGYVQGSEDAPVEIIEYADFQCPACRQVWVLTIQDVKQRLVNTGQVRYTFRDFPLDIHPNARSAHHAAACADEQGFFWPMHDQLFANQGEWSVEQSPESAYRGYAEAVGADVSEYDACMGEGRYRARIQASFEGGMEMGVSSTPTLILGDHRYNGMPYDQLRAIVDSLAELSTQ